MVLVLSNLLSPSARARSNRSEGGVPLDAHVEGMVLVLSNLLIQRLSVRRGRALLVVGNFEARRGRWLARWPFELRVWEVELRAVRVLHRALSCESVRGVPRQETANQAEGV